INLTGNLSVSGGTLDLKNGSTTGSTTINVSGNVSVSSGATLTKTSGTVATGSINFNKSGTQTFTGGGTIGGAIAWTINSGSTGDFGTSVLSGTGTFTLTAGGGIITANTSASGALTTSGANG